MKRSMDEAQGAVPPIALVPLHMISSSSRKLPQAFGRRMLSFCPLAMQSITMEEWGPEPVRKLPTSSTIEREWGPEPAQFLRQHMPSPSSSDPCGPSVSSDPCGSPSVPGIGKLCTDERVHMCTFSVHTAVPVLEACTLQNGRFRRLDRRAVAAALVDQELGHRLVIAVQPQVPPDHLRGVGGARPVLQRLPAPVADARHWVVRERRILVLLEHPGAPFCPPTFKAFLRRSIP